MEKGKKEKKEQYNRLYIYLTNAFTIVLLYSHFSDYFSTILPTQFDYII